MPTHPLETYLADGAATRATGAATDETALYPVLKDLLDARKPQSRASRVSWA